MSAASVRLLVAAIAALWCADRELAAVPARYRLGEAIPLNVPGLAEERHVLIAHPSP